MKAGVKSTSAFFPQFQTVSATYLCLSGVFSTQFSQQIKIFFPQLWKIVNLQINAIFMPFSDVDKMLSVFILFLFFHKIRTYSQCG